MTDFKKGPTIEPPLGVIGGLATADTELGVNFFLNEFLGDYYDEDTGTVDVALLYRVEHVSEHVAGPARCSEDAAVQAFLEEGVSPIRD